MFVVHSSDSIHFSHAHLYKYANVEYSPVSLGYTRIGLGDPNNNSFIFQHCGCFHIFKEPNEQMMADNCYYGNISLEENQDHEYLLNESLISEKSKNNQVLMSRTNNFMPHFVDNLLKYSKFPVRKRSKNNSGIQRMERQKMEYKRKPNQS
jgi:hypothetical protein